jgi:3-oxoacyl-[acyl-carrier protein] reductase
MGQQMPAGTAVVTGGCGALGTAVAARLSDAGMTVAILDRAAGPTRGLHVRCDVTDVHDVTAAMDVVARELGPIGALVCTAGVLTRSPIAELAPDEWDRVIDVSLKGTYLAARAALAHMTDHAGAAIVGFSSGMGRKGMLNGAHYAAAKSGVEALVKSLALELGPRGIRANAVAPGPIESEMTAQLGGPERAALASEIPLGRLGDPADVADPVAFLVGAGSRYMTGQVLHVNGGLLMP